MFAAVTESLLVFSDGLKIKEVCTKLGGVMDDPKNVLSFKTIGVFLNANNKDSRLGELCGPRERGSLQLNSHLGQKHLAG